jgi:hypothetical protein
MRSFPPSGRAVNPASPRLFITTLWDSGGRLSGPRGRTFLSAAEMAVFVLDFLSAFPRDDFRQVRLQTDLIVRSFTPRALLNPDLLDEQCGQLWAAYGREGGAA